MSLKWLANWLAEDNTGGGARGSRRTSSKPHAGGVEIILFTNFSLFLTARSKQWAVGFRVVDDQTRREQNQARLETLERENYDDRENNIPEDEDFKVVLDSDDDEGGKRLNEN